jgi:hypothetical protein
MTSQIVTLADPCEALCYHVLALMAWGADDAAGWGARGEALARSLARLVSVTKCADEFVSSLRDLCDDVTRHPLVSGMDSHYSAVVPLVQDLFAAWLGDAAANDPDFARTHKAAHGVHIAGGLTLSTTVSVADVLAYSAPLQGVLEADSMGAVPVCVDARVVRLLKRIGVLRTMTQYHEQYTRAAGIIDEIVVAFADEPDCNMTVCWQLIADHADAALWTCLKVELGELVSACTLVQGDTEAWRTKVIDSTYELVNVARPEESGMSEGATNTMFIAALGDAIAQKYGNTKLQSPTHGQAVLYLRLLMFRMREKRRMRDAGSCGAPELRYEGGNSEADVPPFSLRDVVVHAAGRGIVVQNAARTASFALASFPQGDALLMDAQGGVATCVTGGESDLDALVMDKKRGALWRATVLQPTARAGRAAEARLIEARALLEQCGGQRWFEVPR